jgi:zinc protease
MKNVLTGIVIGASLAACGKPADAPRGEEATADADRIFDMPYLMRDLDNGLRVIIVPTDFPDIVTIQIPVQTGSRNEVEPGKSGFAHFFEHMMFRGTEKYPADVYLNTLKKAGAKQNAYTTDDYTNYFITFTKDDLEKVIELEADRFQNLSYSEDVFRTEALAVKGEYLKNYSNPLLKAYERLRALAFDKHTYGHTTMGFLEDIEAMPDQFDYSRTFFDRWYRPEKTSVILVGDLDAEKTFELVRKYWGDWKPGDFEADIPVEPPLDGPVYEHIAWDGPTQPWLLVAFRGPAFDTAGKDMPAVDVLSSIYFSDSSDLYRKLVLEDQFVDQLAVNMPNRKDPNLLTVYARLTDAGRAADVEAAIHSTLADARSRLVPGKKLEETKSRLRYSFTSDLDNAGAIGGMLATYVHFDRTPETINELYRGYDALTAEDIRSVADRYFVDQRRVTVTLSTGEAIAGFTGKRSIDEQVAEETVPERSASAMDDEQVAESPPERSASAMDTDDAETRPDGIEPLPFSGDAVPVSLVARPSSTSPLVDVSILFHAGAAMDPAGKKGLAALTAAMVADAGSEALSISAINAAMYPIAAGFDAQVDKEMTRLSGQVHRDNLDLWYSLVRGQLLTPGWREQDFARVQTQLINAIRTSLVANNDEELGKEVLYREIYGAEHPYGSYNLGNSSELAALTLNDVRNFYRDHYTIDNVTVGLAGGYPDDFAAMLGNDLQMLPRGESELPALPQPKVLSANRAAIVEKETASVAVSIGFPIELRRGDPDWAALWLVRSWLGEHRNSSGQLYKRIRETRGMNYGDYAYIEYFPRGMYRSDPDTNLGRRQQIFQLWLRPLRDNNDAHFATRTALHELNKLIESGMSEQEFETSKSFLSRYVSLLMDGQSRQLGYAIDSQYYETGDFAEYVRSSLERLTLNDVNRVIRANLRTDNLQYVFVSKDAEDLKARLLGNRASPMSYDAEQSPSLLEEDRRIQSLPLIFEEDDVTVVPAEAVFR